MKTKIKNMNLKQKIYIYNSILGTTSFFEYIEETKYADEPEIRNNPNYDYYIYTAEGLKYLNEKQIHTLINERLTPSNIKICTHNMSENYFDEIVEIAEEDL